MVAQYRELGVNSYSRRGHQPVAHRQLQICFDCTRSDNTWDLFIGKPDK